MFRSWRQRRSASLDLSRWRRLRDSDETTCGSSKVGGRGAPNRKELGVIGLSSLMSVERGLRVLLREIERIISSSDDEKVVVVSQWTSMLNIVAFHLTKKRIGFTCISGEVPVKNRQPIVNELNSDPRGPRILLLSLKAGGQGLNLIGANHLFLLDPHWNPQCEQQATDRIYRIGQGKPTFIHK
ncbi:unnamed protein product [Cyprideis torosa]|uniref:Uncharacterized protein n=1 Tax=Cyprideis torosa TaxID=163714 RepID=A0A7R8WGT6_9CRUS|nr:unnamed protein product [Cyprideis torosa]CAG0897007.1 unnamed protein product [Cyprideis torosa]